MGESDSEDLPVPARSAIAETGPFVLRTLLEDLPLSATGDQHDVEINCVEFLGMCILGWDRNSDRERGATN